MKTEIIEPCPKCGQPSLCWVRPSSVFNTPGYFECEQSAPPKVLGPVVCNLAAWFNAPDVGYKPAPRRRNAPGKSVSR